MKTVNHLSQHGICKKTRVVGSLAKHFSIMKLEWFFHINFINQHDEDFLWILNRGEHSVEQTWWAFFCTGWSNAGQSSYRWKLKILSHFLVKWSWYYKVRKSSNKHSRTVEALIPAIPSHMLNLPRNHGCLAWFLIVLRKFIIFSTANQEFKIVILFFTEQGTLTSTLTWKELKWNIWFTCRRNLGITSENVTDWMLTFE